MRGISEERLRVLLKQYESGSPSFHHLLRLLEKECQELNQWQPIDENTPKDRRILLLTPSIKNQSINAGRWWDKHENIKLKSMWIYDNSGIMGFPYTSNHQPTHWQELPHSPELPEPPK